jgi:hypothetical protein
MTTYTATFRTDAEYAIREFAADTPEQALTKARRFYKAYADRLLFERYDDSGPVNEIVIVCDEQGHHLAVWLDDDQRLRLAARDLLVAAELVVARWERGDLAGAVRQLDAAIVKAKGGAA